MFELDEATRRALSQRYGPTPESQARVLAELRGTLSGPTGPEGGSGSGGTPSGQLVWIAKICAATAGLTGAGLLVLKLGATVIDDGDVPEPRVAPAKIDTPESAPVELPTTEQPTPKLDVDARESARPRVVVPAQTPAKQPQASSSLAAELALLDAATRLRESDPKEALRRLEQHQKEFPAGALAPEREALRVEVLRAIEERDSFDQNR